MPEWWAWLEMRRRCNKPNFVGYRYYGGRGIKVHPDWDRKDGFQSFFDHVGKRPSEQYSLDRIDSNKNYEPDNVRWALVADQNRNRTYCRMFTIEGETKCLAEWVAAYGANRDLVVRALNKGKSIEVALTEKPKRPKTFQVGEYEGTIPSLCKIFGIKPITVYARLKRGIPLEAAFNNLDRRSGNVL